MNTKKIILPLVALFLLAGCNSSGAKKTSKTSSSQPGSKTNQPIPSYPDLPSYPDYDPSGAGIAPNHITAISITPTKEIYARVGDIIPIDGSASGPKDPDDPKNTDKNKLTKEQYLKEKTLSFSVDKDTHLGVTPLNNKNGIPEDASLKCLAVGDATLTASSYQNRFKRTLLVHILPNDATYDMYETALSTDSEKSKFGFGSTSYMAKGVSNGVSQLGHLQWRWQRSQPGTISTSSGALSFGTAKSPEGAMDFYTYFVKPVKSVTFGIASARSDSQTNEYQFGSSKLTASLGENSLSRIAGGKTYEAGEECYTLKGTDDYAVLPHKILCNDQSGDFEVHLSESVGYIRLKYIIVEYAEYTPSGTLTDVNFNFDEETFSDDFAKTTITDSSNKVDVVLSKAKKGDQSTSNHPMLNRNATMTITPKVAGETIASIELVTSPFIYDEKPIENVVQVRESYLGSSQMRAYGTERTETINLSRLSYGCNVVELKAATGQIVTQEADPKADPPVVEEKIDITLGIISLKVVLTDAVASPTVDEVYIAGKANKMDYDGGDSFDPTGAAIVVNFTDPGILPIQINDLMSWPELHEGDTETTGTSSYGDCLVTGLTTGEYVPKVWEKATKGVAGKYLAVSRDTHLLLDASSSTDAMKNGSSNKNIHEYFENDEIHGDYAVDHSTIVIIDSATSGKVKFMNADQTQYFNDVASNCKFSFKSSTSSGSARNHTFALVDSELVLYFEKSVSSVAYTYTLCLTTYDYFGYVDLNKNPELCKEHVDFYKVK